jgi:hypothetical protein
MENNEPERATLDMVSAVFMQEGNCVDGGDETITVEYKSDLGVDNTDGGFFVIKTEQWAFENIEEFAEMIKRVEQIMGNNGK